MYKSMPNTRRHGATLPASISFMTALVLAFLTPSLAAAIPEGLEEQAHAARDHSHEPRRGEIPHDAEMERAVRESGLDLVAVKHEGWPETLYTFSRIKLHAITGRTRLAGQHPSYTILSMMFQGHEWLAAPVLPVGHPEVGRLLRVEDTSVSASEIIDSPHLHELIHALEDAQARRERLDELTGLTNAVEQVHRLGREDRVLTMFEHEGISASHVVELLEDRDALRAVHRERDALRETVNRERPFRRAAERLLNSTHLLTSLGDHFLIVPDVESVDGRWVQPVAFAGDRTPGLIDSGRDFENALSLAFSNPNPGMLSGATQQFLDVATASRAYPSQAFRSSQNIYVRYNFWNLAAWTYLLSAALFGLWFFFQRPGWYWAGIGAMGAGFLLHSGVMLLRTYLRSYEADFRLPVSNMFESITFTAWAVLLIAMVWEVINRRAFIGVAATVLGFLFLTGAAMMPLHETRIQPLRAVLNSYWLNIHVTMMLLSYAAFALAAVFAIVYLAKSFLGRDALFGGTPIMDMPRTEEFAYRLVQIGWPLLTLGVALGAVWADHAWGRYWGWDPKETWAFITWVTYTIYLHTRIVLGWRGRLSAATCVLGFVMVLITWLGVSYLPWFAGGLHTYASPN